MSAREDGWTELGHVVSATFYSKDGDSLSVQPGVASSLMFAPVGTSWPGIVLVTCPDCRQRMPKAEQDGHECP